MAAYHHAEREGHLLVVTFTRPEAANALNTEACQQLHGLFDEFSQDPSLWVAIVTGAGERAFCAGMDLKDSARGEGLRLPPSGFAGLTHRFDNFKPVIAAVNGAAYGGGMELVLACDLVVASEQARFALSEPRVGVAALAGGVHRLVRQIGQKAAMSMLLTGRAVDATEALRMGFVNEVVPQQDVLARARALADQVLACAPRAVRATKQLALEGLDHPLSTAMARQYTEVDAMLRSPDVREGARAFAEKRAPVWSGEG